MFSRNPIPAPRQCAALLIIISLVTAPLCRAGPDAADRHAPAVGQSLFDSIFLSADGSGRYDVPFPFSRIMATLERQLGASINRDANTLRSVFIPLGRCINRRAAEPRFFRHPRLVVAVDSEHYGSNFLDQPFLKDRLFIGYQEKARAMEVISYNERAGRFEFQVVTGYERGQTPRVRYAERARCTACHQNAGPVFAQPPWDETDQNPDIYRLLVDARPDPGGVAATPRRSDALEIDGASNRANLLAMFQEFWRGVCDADARADFVRCRAGLLEAVLRYRLQEQGRALHGSPLVTDYLLPVSRRSIPRNWPDGLSIASSDIDNRNPLFHGADAHLESARRLREPRLLTINWNPSDFLRGIEGLGAFIPLADVHRLDRRLHGKALRGGAGVRLTGPCVLRRQDPVGDPVLRTPRTGDLSLDCRLNEGALSRPYTFLGDLYVEGGELKSLPVFSRLLLDGGDNIIGMTHRGGRIADGGASWRIDLEFRDSRQQFHARLPGVGIIAGMRISWPKSRAGDPLFDSRSPVTGRAELVVLPDGEFLDRALAGLVETADRGGDNPLSQAAFQGPLLMDALLHELDRVSPGG